jgi:hypothetical protein
MTDEKRVSDLTLSEAMKLWREHGGDNFGPRVEHVSMKQAGFLDFCNALLARRSQQEPDGWRLVPVEPTEAMIGAGVNEAHRQGGSYAASEIYRAMIAAAPQSTEGK